MQVSFKDREKADLKAAGIAIPIGITALLIYALIKKVNIYKAFIEGAGRALPELISILPPLAAMLAAINILRESGAMDIISSLLTPLTERIGIDGEIVPLILMRPFSGSASLAMLRDLLVECGADSKTGRAAAVMVGSTETIFYTTAVYFGAAGVQKTRHAIPAALISGIVGTAAAILLTQII